MRGIRGVVAAALAGLCIAGPAGAEERVAWILGPPDASVALSQAFLRSGYDVTRRAWDGAGPVPEINLPRGARLVVHVTGAGEAGRGALARRLDRLARLGAGPILLVTEACGDWPAGDWTLAAPAAGGETCPDPGLTETLRETLAAPGAALPARVRRAGPGVGPLTEARAAPAAEPIVIGTLGAARPATGGVSIGAAPATVPRATPVGLRIGAAPLPARLPAAEATPEGLPRPSIIVGVIRTPEEEDAAVDLDETLGAGSADTYEMRERLRASDPEGYAELVASGAFDPLPGDLPTVLQQVLQRMGCYRLGVDGDWGNGSRASVDRYYATRGDAAPTREATDELFRDVILREDVVCPAPAPAAVRSATPRQTTTRRATTPARSTAARPSAPARSAPAAAPSTGGGRINPTFNGAFR
ncbi:hypothetical protein [Jannaschia marina]|uniref:hypothetical protein n=1 Tax=Jannaschia marina TaxID=2741674 RepID=UPI0015CB47F5|nr:hypothetical protein [Jannaschia marina]